MFHQVEGLPVLHPLKTLSLDGKRHYVLPDKSIVPSVTTLLGRFEQAGIQRWRNNIGHKEADRISAEACKRGESYHSLIEHYLQNEPFEKVLQETDDGDLQYKFKAVVPVLDRVSNIYYQEACLYSARLKLAGRCDLIGDYYKIRSVVDFKTARKPKKIEYIQNYFQQATAYGIMFKEITGLAVDQIVIIIGADGLEQPQVFVEKLKDHIPALMDKIERYYYA